MVPSTPPTRTDDASQGGVAASAPPAACASASDSLRGTLPSLLLPAVPVLSQLVDGLAQEDRRRATSQRSRRVGEADAELVLVTRVG